MNINPDFIAKVSTQVTDKNQTTAEVVAALNAKVLDNPLSIQPTIPVPFDFGTLLGLVGKDSLAKLVNYVHFDKIVTDVRNRDRAAVGLWSIALAAATIMTQGESDAIVAALSQTVPDPSWQAKLSWSEINFKGLVTEKDIRQCKLGLKDDFSDPMLG